MFSAMLEALLSALQAPLRMAAHTVFVLGSLTGLNLTWQSPPRLAGRMAWLDAARVLGTLSVAAGLALGEAFVADPGMALWLAPMTLPLLLAVPIVVWSGRPEWGRWLRRAGLLLTPEEVAPPSVLLRAWAQQAVPGLSPASP